MLNKIDKSLKTVYSMGPIHFILQLKGQIGQAKFDLIGNA